MASVKKIVNPLGDEGSQETFKTVSSLKNTAGDVQQLTKLARSHHQATQSAIETGKQLVDHLVKVTTKMESRLGSVSQSLIEISSTEKGIFAKMEDYNNTMSEKLSAALSNHLQHERTEIQLFEKNFHKRHAEILAQLRKAEKATKKSGKKSPYQLQQAIQELTDKMNEITLHRQQKLEEILRMERKRYCYLVDMLLTTIDAQTSFYQASNQILTDQYQNWKSVANSVNDLPPECMALIKNVGVKERTSAVIQGGELSASNEYYDEGYYDESYAEGYEEAYDEYEGYDESYDEGAAVGVKARALYDYVGSTAYELNFKAGDIILVTKEDPATGWWTGELNGVVGPFPGNYVEKL